MKKGSWQRLLAVLVLALLLSIGGSVIGGFAQDQGQGEERFKLLIVDETRTFSSSMRVEVLARALIRTELFDLSAKIIEVSSSFDDPLQGEEPDQQYDVILIVPAGIDDGTVKQIWVVTQPFTEISEELRDAVATVKQAANGIFRGAAEAVDVTEDLLPGYFAAIFIKEGWL
ncbi:MAG: hypothetical protein ACE5LQ_07805 [Candidatus Bipolaricaulia bacterium]